MKSLAARFITKADNGAKSGSGAPGDMRLAAENLVNVMSEEFPILVSSLLLLMERLNN